MGALGISNPVLCSDAELTAYQATASIIPLGFDEIFVLTDNAGNILEAHSIPSFETNAVGDYLIYNIVSNTNLNGYGNISGILGYANAINICITVQSNPLQVQITDCTPPPAECPLAQAGALGTENTTICAGDDLIAYKTSAAIIPVGYTEMFLLADNAGNLLELEFSPSFTVNEIGNYYIYNLIANIDDFDINNYGSISDILSYANASDICVSLQNNPLQVQVTDCTPPSDGCPAAQLGDLGIGTTTVCAGDDIIAYKTSATMTPTDYTEMFLLTDNAGNLLEINFSPSFTVNELGNY